MTLKVPSAKLDVSSTRSISGSPKKIILSWSFCPLSNLSKFLKSSGISKLLVDGETGKTSSRCLHSRCAVRTKFSLDGRASWVAMLSVMGWMAVATTTVGVLLSLRSLMLFKTSRASSLPVELSWLCWPLVSIKFSPSVIAVKRGLYIVGLKSGTPAIDYNGLLFWFLTIVVD